MTTPADVALERLAATLDDADQTHAADVEALADLDDDQVDYLGRVDERSDPATDGLEGRCV